MSSIRQVLTNRDLLRYICDYNINNTSKFIKTNRFLGMMHRWNALRDKVFAVGTAVRAGNSHALLWLLQYKKDQVYWLDAAYYATRKPYKFDVFCIHMPVILQYLGLYHAIICGKLPAVIVLVDALKNLDDMPVDVMDAAIRKGDLEIVRWLHNNTPAKPSKWGLVWAIDNDYYTITEWLLNNRTECDVDFALEMAGNNMSLSREMVVKWVIRNKLKN